MGWERSRLGYPVTSTVCGLVDSGCVQHFQGGSLYSTGTATARFVTGAIRDRYVAARAESGTLGYPTTDEFCGLRGGGCAQHFQRGSIYWSPVTGARLVTGAVRDRWAATGWELGRLGYPVSDTICGLADSGCYQLFQGGSLYSSASTPARIVTGAIRDRWAATGWEGGLLGYPTTDEFCGLRGGGCGQHFQKGSVYWSPSTGARAVTGAVRDRWAAVGWERSALGYPVTDTVCGLVDTGCAQHFQFGSLYGSASTPVHFVNGVIRDRWATTGSERGPLGYPTTDGACAAGACTQTFQHGVIQWWPATGARVVSGVLADRWTALGGATGRLGRPVGDTFCGLVAGGCFQLFERGSLYTSDGVSPAYVVTGAIRDRWAASGWERGALGYPTADEICGLPNGGCSQEFQHGSIQWSPATGARVVVS
jgi:uncharacterized protein with LGFP repeats